MTPVMIHSGPNTAVSNSLKHLAEESETPSRAERKRNECDDFLGGGEGGNLSCTA